MAKQDASKQTKLFTLDMSKFVEFMESGVQPLTPKKLKRLFVFVAEGNVDGLKAALLKISTDLPKLDFNNVTLPWNKFGEGDASDRTPFTLLDYAIYLNKEEIMQLLSTKVIHEYSTNEKSLQQEFTYEHNECFSPEDSKVVGDETTEGSTL